MGKCRLCGKDAGLLRSVHKECEERYTAGKNMVAALAVGAIRSGIDRSRIETKVNEFACQYDLDMFSVKPILLSAWDAAVADALSDELLTTEEESRLVDLAEFFGASKEELSQRDSCIRLTKAAVIRDLCEGKIPERVKVQGDLPVSLQNDEKIIWLFQDVEYYESRTRTHYVGGSHGISVRVMKGMYYRVGAFRGEPVQTTANVHVDTGMLVVTNKHLTFVGSNKSIRIKHEKIVSYTPYSDGVAVCRDAATAKPQIFITGDGWFTYNVMRNAGNI